MTLGDEKEALRFANEWIWFGQRLGWQCYGCDDDRSATFYRQGEYLRGDKLFITKEFREDIERALRKEFNRGLCSDEEK